MSRTGLRGIVTGIPVIGPLLLQWRRQRRRFTGSADYWEQRYNSGGNSGAGSYNRLSHFKADFLNQFVAEKRVASVIEFGSGDGAQLKLASYPRYIGVDVSPKAVAICQRTFADDSSKRFLLSDEVTSNCIADLALSLDVIYHLVEDSVFEAYMQRLFQFARRFVIIYSSNTDQDWPAKHVRHRRFTGWIEEHKPDWALHSTLKNAYPYDPASPDGTSFADFYVFTPDELIRERKNNLP